MKKIFLYMNIFKKFDGSVSQQFSARLNGEKNSSGNADVAREAPSEPLVQDLHVRVQ